MLGVLRRLLKGLLSVLGELAKLRVIKGEFGGGDRAWPTSEAMLLKS